jgi:hypothetical protein
MTGLKIGMLGSNPTLVNPLINVKGKLYPAADYLQGTG